MYFHQLHGLRYGKTGCVEELCFHSSKTVPYWIVPIFGRLAFFGNPPILSTFFCRYAPCPNMYKANF